MVYRGQLGSLPAAVSLKNSSVSIAVGAGSVVAWDLGGRLYSVFRGGHTFRRGLGGRVLHKWRAAGEVPDALGPYDERQRAVLAPRAADRLLDDTAGLAARVARAVMADPSRWPGDGGRCPGEPVAEALAAAARFDAAAARADAARFSEVYSPIGILPPDQYMSVVLQATVGCSFGTCTFCNLYREGYRVKAPAEFADHVAAVRAFLGRSLSLREQSVFLGAANALAVPMPRLVQLMERVAAAFPGRPVQAFVDGFTGLEKDATAYRALAGLGLRRVYVGLESGHDALLAFVRKPATSAQAIDTVRAVRAGGIAVGVIVMIGLGGERFAEPHAAETVAAVNAMGLGPADLLYFSDLVEFEGSAYASAASSIDLRPLPLAGRIAQLRAIRGGLRFPGAPPKLARYDIREFVY